MLWADPDRISDAEPAWAPTDPYYYLQFHLKNSLTRNGIHVDINVESAWDFTLGSAIRVAVIDDGVDILHGNSGGGFSGDIIGPFGGSSGYDLLWNPSRPDEHAFRPCCNDTHGTSVAGIIAATHGNGTGGAGVAPNVIINAVRIFRKTYPPERWSRDPRFDNASDNQIADGINWAWRHANSDVLNNSWGGGDSSVAITNAIQDALTQGRGGRGSVVVFAAGNTSDRENALKGAVHYPASLSGSLNVISVGAINRYGGAANYTPEYGPIDVVAPSGHYNGFCVGEVVTTDRYSSPGCNDGPSGDINYTGTFSGTSAAAPQVSGAAALMLALRPSLTASEVRSRIRAAADFWGQEANFGAGKLNVWYSVAPLVPPPPPTFSVSISGPNPVQPVSSCLFQAIRDNGVEPYSYAWTADGTPVGSDSPFYRHPAGTNGFELGITVTDGQGRVANSSFSVSVNSSAPECLDQ